MKTGSGNDRTAIVKELESLLKGGNAHATFEHAVENMPAELQGKVPSGSVYSVWQLVEHIRIVQWDILEFCKGPDHKSPNWPEDYWLKNPAPPDGHAWKKALDAIAADRKAFIALLHERAEDLHTPFAYGDGQTLFREALLIGDHSSYHTGEIILTRRLLGNWG